MYLWSDLMQIAWTAMRLRCCGQVRAASSTVKPINISNQLMASYEKAKKGVMGQKIQRKTTNPRAVFVNNELNLKNLNVYGKL